MLVSEPSRVRAAAQAKLGLQLDAARPDCQRFRVDQQRPNPRERAFVGARETLEQDLAGAKAEHRVAQELQSLVVGDTTALVGVARVCERLLQVRRILGKPEQQRDPVQHWSGAQR